MKLEFSQHVFEKTPISNFIKIHPEGDKFFHTDRHDKANSLFCAIVRTHQTTIFELTHFHCICGYWEVCCMNLITDPSTFIKQI
jgi:hypothetical protein